jgi:hypothetical protein
MQSPSFCWPCLDIRSRLDSGDKFRDISLTCFGIIRSLGPISNTLRRIIEIWKVKLHRFRNRGGTVEEGVGSSEAGDKEVEKVDEGRS